MVINLPTERMQRHSDKDFSAFYLQDGGEKRRA